MSTCKYGKFSKIILISTPWPLFNRPSIQLGTLKSYLNKQLPDTQVTAEHFYLNAAEAIGFKTYQAISKRIWLSESIYAAMLYPERSPQIEALFMRLAGTGKDDFLSSEKFAKLVRCIKQLSNEYIHQTNWENYGLVGFSVSLCQLTSSLYFIKQIKRVYPEIIIVAGGSIVSGKFASEYLNQFPEIDCIVSGEGELPLVNFVQHLQTNGSMEEIHHVNGVVTKSSESQSVGEFYQMTDLQELPAPDYAEYFQILQSFTFEKRFFPSLPVETSRGCWWKRARNQKGIKGCAFCNLNMQWEGYRKKDTHQVVREIDDLTNRYQTLSVDFIDNVLPPKSSSAIFSELKKLPKDFKLFSEIRSSTNLKTLQIMKESGMHEVQVGIEAFSTRLLQRMNKGSTAIQNLEIMKNCEAVGLKNLSNLILHFPGSDENDVIETLRVLDYAVPFRPLRTVYFWLGLESSVWQNFRLFGIRSVCNHPNYRILFPDRIVKSIPFMIQAYQGDRKIQRKIWKPVEKRVKMWSEFYHEMHKQPFDEPILGFRDGGSFLIIYQRQYKVETLQHRMTDTSRKIYLYCLQHRSLGRISSKFPEISKDNLMSFLHMMSDKRLMFAEGDRYLSLAVPLS